MKDDGPKQRSTQLYVLLFGAALLLLSWPIVRIADGGGTGWALGYVLFVWVVIIALLFLIVRRDTRDPG